MDTNICSCGKEATHRCTSGDSLQNLCKNCMQAYIDTNPFDLITPIRPNFRANVSSDDICNLCNNAPSEKLQILSNSAKPVCKVCYTLLQSNKDAIFISIKWKDVVFSFNDLHEIQTRNELKSRAFEEIEKVYSTESIQQSVIVFRDAIIAAANRFADIKLEEAKKVITTSNESSRSLKKEVEKQIMKKNPDISTLGGKLASSLLTTGVPCALPGFKINQTLAPEEISDIIQSLFESCQVNEDRSEHNVLLFNPGKNNITKIDIERMQKQELIFEKNWTFEASWLELESGDVFFCGGNGNGISNPEVLLVDTHSMTIQYKNQFIGRSGHSIVEVAGRIYVFGGNVEPIAERYNFSADNWEQLADIPITIPKTSACQVPDGIFLAGMYCANPYVYSIERNSYLDTGRSLELFMNKNKIVFSNEDKVYCMCCDKLYVCHASSIGSWTTHDILDRDWWSYSKPVIYNNCAYFIKYFVRNLWILNLSTFELHEHLMGDIPSVNR